MGCKYCGQEFKKRTRGKDSNLYCSRECAFADKKARPKEKEKHTVTCVICDKEFEGRANSKYCSDECHKIYSHNLYLRYKQTEDYANRLKRDRESYKPKPLYNHICLTCKKAFKSKSTKAIYCNDKCNPNRRMHTGKVSKAKRMRVWKRDGFICMLCGQPLKMSEIDSLNSGRPHPLAPTVDHIIPVSIATKDRWKSCSIHSESNLQAAHFICNVKRGNRTIDEYLKIC